MKKDYIWDWGFRDGQNKIEKANRFYFDSEPEYQRYLQGHSAGLTFNLPPSGYIVDDKECWALESF